MRVALVSTYDLGHQPFGLASPAAWLRAAGHEVVCVDSSRTPLSAALVRDADLVAFHLPMHTATRLALPLLRRAREENRSVTLVTYGLYSPMNEPMLREAGVDVVLGVECEQVLVEIAAARDAGGPSRDGRVFADRNTTEDRARTLPRLAFRVPDRASLPPVSRYAHLRLPNGARRASAYTEASRGCKHWCAHCPVVPVYRGQFRVVPVDVVMDDIAQQVGQGATHVTFGDPDFLNAPKHAVAVADAFAARFGGLGYDVTVKVEHLVKHADLLPRLRDTGCLLITSAFEAFDDRILARLKKGHTRADALSAMHACRRAGIALAPTFVAFTPWTTSDGYVRFLAEISAADLVEHVAPIQLALRLLIPHGSLLLEDDEVRDLVAPFDRERLLHPWTHHEPAVDALQREVEALVGSRLNASRCEVFSDVARLAASMVPGASMPSWTLSARASVPYLEEPWYC
jgi:radical SAM superfamily enzyme YgiQ (UPF0313 family)